MRASCDGDNGSSRPARSIRLDLRTRLLILVVCVSCVSAHLRVTGRKREDGRAHGRALRELRQRLQDQTSTHSGHERQ
ncbi:hypothetical protein WJX84_009789, partial [Apatococcus fuscideae]